jgi:uncharacterized phage protein gp47/JayE
MAGPFPLATLAAQVTSTGISKPSYADVLASLTASFQAIFGSNVYLSPDSQDGQWLALLAKAFDDMNNQLIALYNSISPAVAQGVELSSLVKLNGLQRKSATFSTAPGNVVGTAGTVISGGVVADANGNLWNLPATVTIPVAGTVPVTVTAQQPGAIAAALGTINRINSPQLGWQSFSSTSDATLGQPIETDAALRKRQAAAVALPANSTLDGLLTALLALPGVTRCAIYENTSLVVDANGLPSKSISVVIEGGVLASVASTIGQKKGPGSATYGTTSLTYVDPITGIVYTINFFVLALTAVSVVVTGSKLSGWASTNAADIQAAISAYITGLGIGKSVQYSRVWAPAYLGGIAEGLTYQITALTLNAGTVDIVIPFNQAAKCAVADVTVNIT